MKLRIILLMLLTGILIEALLCGCNLSMNEQKTEYDAKLAAYVPDKKIGAIGEPTNTYFPYKNISFEDLESVDTDEYAAVFIFPSKVDEILANRELRRVLKGTYIPLVLIDQPDLTIVQLIRGYPSQHGDDGNNNGDIQYIKTFPQIDEHKEVNFYNTTLHSKINGYLILVDSLIIFNISQNSSEALDALYKIDDEREEYISIYPLPAN